MNVSYLGEKSYTLKLYNGNTTIMLIGVFYSDTDISGLTSFTLYANAGDSYRFYAPIYQGTVGTFSPDCIMPNAAQNDIIGTISTAGGDFELKFSSLSKVDLIGPGSTTVLTSVYGSSVISQGYRNRSMFFLIDGFDHVRLLALNAPLAPGNGESTTRVPIVAGQSFGEYIYSFSQAYNGGGFSLSASGGYVAAQVLLLWNSYTPEPPTPTGDDPFLPGGTSEIGGGDGTFGENRFGDGIDDETIDTPDYDPLDQLNRSVLGSNFVNVYAPTRAQLLSLKNYLWSSDIGDTLKKMFNNPMDSIVTLHMVPVTVPTSASSIHLGGTDTEIGSNIVTNQYVTVNCGSMTIGEYWDAYLDYSPYTKMFLYLPFCGMHEIDVDEFMGQSISIRYDVDVVSGDCLASVSATRSGGLSTVLYQYAGNCSVEIPVSMANYNARVSAYLGLVGSAAGVVAGVASGGMSAPLAATALASSAANIATAKKTIQRSGAIAGSTAWMSQLKPYFILVQPSQCLPENQAHFTGYPSFITASVGDLSGYTEFAEIHLEGISATDSEKAEIESILKGGVLI